MQMPGVSHSRTILLVLACLVPLMALAATLFLHTPVGATGMVALLVFAPIAYSVIRDA
jgi:hypothetical protein